MTLKKALTRPRPSRQSNISKLCCRWDEAMDIPEGIDARDVGIGQWRQGISFGEFSELTVKKHHQQ